MDLVNIRPQFGSGEVVFSATMDNKVAEEMARIILQQGKKKNNDSKK